MGGRQELIHQLPCVTLSTHLIRMSDCLCVFILKIHSRYIYTQAPLHCQAPSRAILLANVIFIMSSITARSFPQVTENVKEDRERRITVHIGKQKRGKGCKMKGRGKGTQRETILSFASLLP